MNHECASTIFRNDNKAFNHKQEILESIKALNVCIKEYKIWKKWHQSDHTVGVQYYFSCA